MNIFLCLALFAGQMNTLQQKTTIHLGPRQYGIIGPWGGDLIELINAPERITLPADPPQSDALGNPWSVDVKNMGPKKVTLFVKDRFSVIVNVGQTVHVYSSGKTYVLKQR